MKEESIKNLNNNKNIEIINNGNFPPKKKKLIINKIDSGKTKKRRKKKKKKSLFPANKRENAILNEHSSNMNNQIIKSNIKMNSFENSETKNIIYKKGKNSNENDQNKNNKKLDDLDLNNSSYERALELDKRTFEQIYWSRLKTKHLIIFTFISCHDYNLQYIKISRFVFLVCTSMALNVFFFFDSSMHKIYLDYGNYNFIQQLPQILYSTIVSLIIEIIIGILSYTDINIYQIRQIEQATLDKIEPILKKMKKKLIIYFIITFMLFLFYWYFISTFCAVYNNTQIIYIKDFISSFSIGLVYPFIIQLVFTLI